MKKTKYSFIVNVSSRLDEEETRKMLDKVINVGLSEAENSLGCDNPEDAEKALDMDISSPQYISARNK